MKALAIMRPGDIRLRPAIVAALGILLTTLAVPASSSTTDVSLVYVAERSHGAPAGVTVQASFAWSRTGGYVGSFATYGSGATLVARDGHGADLLPDGDVGARIGTQSLGCATGSSCALSSLVNAQGGLTTYVIGYPKPAQQPDRIYLILRGHDADVSVVDSPGWTVRRAAARVRYVQADGAADLSVQAAVGTTERFTSAHATSSAPLSFALGTPPCRTAHRIGYAREGEGAVTLSGGRSPVTFSCSEPGVTDPVAMATARTVWDLRGDVVGTATGPTRLVVVEFPTTGAPPPSAASTIGTHAGSS